MYKRLWNKIKWAPPFFYNMYISLENSNHILSTDLSSLHCQTSHRSVPLRLGEPRTRISFPFTATHGSVVMKSEFLVDRFASLHHRRMASLLDFWTAEGLGYSGISKRDMQQWQLQTLREPVTPCRLLKACKLYLTVVHIWCSKYCA